MVFYRILVAIGNISGNDADVYTQRKGQETV
jgi:hypothetical protein